MSNEKMTDLLKRQEQDRMNLAAGVFQAWQPVKEKETEILQSYGGSYDEAPDDVKDRVDINRKEFFEEWGAQGKLAILMEARHISERERLMKQQMTAQEIRDSLKNSESQNEKGRGGR